MKQVAQTNISIHMQFAFLNFSLQFCTWFLFGCVLQLTRSLRTDCIFYIVDNTGGDWKNNDEKAEKINDMQYSRVWKILIFEES